MTRAYRDASEPEGSMTNPSEAMIEAGDELLGAYWDGAGRDRRDIVAAIFTAMQQAATPAAPVPETEMCDACDGTGYGVAEDTYCGKCAGAGGYPPAAPVQDDDAEWLRQRGRLSRDAGLQASYERIAARLELAFDPARIGDLPERLFGHSLELIGDDDEPSVLFHEIQNAALLLAEVRNARLTPDRVTPLVEALEQLESKARLGGDCLGNSPPQFASCQKSFYLLADIARTALRDGGFDA